MCNFPDRLSNAQDCRPPPDPIPYEARLLINLQQNIEIPPSKKRSYSEDPPIEEKEKWEEVILGNRAYSPAEDRLLEAEIKKIPLNQRIDWKEIQTNHFPNRTEGGLYQHWKVICSERPDLAKQEEERPSNPKHFTEEENRLLMEEMKKSGRINWAKIQKKHFPDRHKSDLITHWQSICEKRSIEEVELTPISDGLPFKHYTDEEDQLLEEAVKKSSEINWDEIQKLFPNRSKEAVHRHWQRLCDKRKDSGFIIDLQGWALGQGDSYENLCPDF